MKFKHYVISRTRMLTKATASAIVATRDNPSKGTISTTGPATASPVERQGTHTETVGVNYSVRYAILVVTPVAETHNLFCQVCKRRGHDEHNCRSKQRKREGGSYPQNRYEKRPRSNYQQWEREPNGHNHQSTGYIHPSRQQPSVDYQGFSQGQNNQTHDKFNNPAENARPTADAKDVSQVLLGQTQQPMAPQLVNINYKQLAADYKELADDLLQARKSVRSTSAASAPGYQDRQIQIDGTPKN